MNSEAFWTKFEDSKTVLGKFPLVSHLLCTWLGWLIPLALPFSMQREAGETRWVERGQGNSPALVTELRGSEGTWNRSQHTIKPEVKNQVSFTESYFYKLLWWKTYQRKNWMTSVVCIFTKKALSHCLFWSFQRELRLKTMKIIRTFHWGKKTQLLPIPRCCCDNTW